MTSSAAPIVWLTGLPSSGKSTLANRVADTLRQRGRPEVVVLDGDAVRAALCPPLGYDDAARDAFYETLARLAAVIAAQGVTVLVSATANRRAYRSRARAIAPGGFIEVFVDTDLETCRARDAKGLYAQARQDHSRLPGAGATYEVPLEAELVVTPDEERAVDRIIASLC